MGRGSFKVLVAAALLCAVATAGCGEQNGDKPMLSIGFDGVARGALAPRIEDMRRAALMAIENTGADTPEHRLELVDVSRESPPPIASIQTPQFVTERKGTPRELVVSLNSVIWGRPGNTIWLLPRWAMQEQAIDEYRASGLPASGEITADTPALPGTPKNTYITPALSAESCPPAGRRFFRQFADEYGRAPDRYAIYAYEAVGLIVDAIQRLEQARKPVTAASVRASAFSIKNRYGPAGHYDVLPDGRTTFYVFQARGNPAPPLEASLIEVGR